MMLQRMLLLAGCALAGTAAAATADQWRVPVAVEKLDNGLTVVVSEDHSAPVVGISVVYRVGMRLEPRNRTGFAHLFEHLMFQGTPQAGATTAPPAPTSPTTSKPRRSRRWNRCCGWKRTGCARWTSTRKR